MKHLKSSLDDLHYIFERSITVRTLAEPLASFDNTRQAEEVKAFMKKKDYDVVGVRSDGQVVGYVCQKAIPGGIVGDHLMPFEVQGQLDETSTLLEALVRLQKSSQVFVAVMGTVWGIVTKGDLQKAPIRMWLFGVLSLLEMQFIRLIRASYPENSWVSQELILRDRLKKAQKIFRKRTRLNVAIDLADCLEFADKGTIISKTEKLRSALGFQSCTEASKAFKELRELRNDLCHAQDIVTGRWPKLVELAGAAEELLNKCEKW